MMTFNIDRYRNMGMAIVVKSILPKDECMGKGDEEKAWAARELLPKGGMKVSQTQSS